MMAEAKKEERGKIAHGEEGSGEANRGRQTMSSGAHPHLHINTHTYGPCSNHGSYMYTHPSTLAYIPFLSLNHSFILPAQQTAKLHPSISVVCAGIAGEFSSPMEENFLIIIELCCCSGEELCRVCGEGRWKEATNECVE